MITTHPNIFTSYFSFPCIYLLLHKNIDGTLIRVSYEESLTLVVNSIEVACMTLVHPPTRSILLGTVAVILVIVIVPGTELHAIVGCEKLVTRIITKIKTFKGISSISANEVGICQAVFVSFRCHLERGIVGSTIKTRIETSYPELH